MKVLDWLLDWLCTCGEILTKETDVLDPVLDWPLVCVKFKCCVDFVMVEIDLAVCFSSKDTVDLNNVLEGLLDFVKWGVDFEKCDVFCREFWP